MKRKRVLVSVINDLTNDQRVHRICNSLQSNGFDVLLIGRKLKDSQDLSERSYSTKRFKILFNKGFLFYACINIRFFFYMLFSKTDIFLSNDLDTLACNSLAAKLRGKKLVYDSHELFTEIPELLERNTKKKIWLFIEKLFIRKPDLSYTVCNSISDIYNKKYNINMRVIRNLPFSREKQREYSSRQNILIYQGALNKDRGIELLINSMKHISDYKLMIAGKGDIEEDLKNLAESLDLKDRVVFTGNLDFNELYELTSSAKLGFSVEQGESLNYYYALPNKMFDYIQAGVPIICSDYPEMKRIIDEYKVGETKTSISSTDFANQILEFLSNEEELNKFHQNCKIASKELNWEKEEVKLLEIFNSLLD